MIRSPYAALIFAALFWAGNFIAGRALRDDVPPVALNFWRWLLALAVLFPFAVKELRQTVPVIRAHWKLILCL
ncbi:MAG: DMT family transporter, partial [Desulfobacterales bacterium]|nr:DMT family transporter [Desulfobacterales bacterium]